MDGLQWKTLFKMDDLGVKPTIFGNIHMDPWDEDASSPIRGWLDFFDDKM